MPSFSQSLRDYRSGDCSGEDLLGRLDELINSGKTNPIALLNMVNQSHAQEPFPSELHVGITSRLKRYLDQQDQARDPSEELEDDEHTRLATVMDDALISDHSQAAAHAAEDDDERTAFAPIANEPEPEQKQATGTVLNDRFVLEELVGQGGMSLVYRAVDKRKLEARSRKPHVAVKVLEVSSKNESAAFMALQREAQKSQTLSHPNIVRAYDFDRDGDIVFMTMEYLSGSPLSATIKGLNKSGMELPRAMNLIEQMGSALAHAHSHRIVHADFKPGNIILTDEEHIKVIDFGIARAYQQPEDTAADKTLFDPRALGALTPAYASPEMLENLEPDPRDDIYSLGCVAYELITGVHPFSRSRATDARDAGIKPNKPDNLSRRQWNALRKALAFNREERIATVQQLLAGLLPRPTSVPQWAAAGVGLLAVVAAGYWLLSQRAAVEPEVPPEPTVTKKAPAEVKAPPVATTPTPRRPGTVFKDCATCPGLVVLPAGRGQLGSPDTEADRRSFEGPRLEVAVPKDFALSETEVTVAQFGAFVAATNAQLPGCRTLANDWQVDPRRSWQNPGFAQTNQHPVTCVSFDDAQSYVAWLSETTKATYRLPTEAEWEYAARAQSKQRALWDDAATSACAMANVADKDAANAYSDWQTMDCADGYAHTAPVQERLPNAFGLYDVQGNVFEWTEDCWLADYKGRTHSISAIQTKSCSKRVLRGGSWFTAPSEQRLAFRNRAGADQRAQTYGIRVVREL